MESVLVYDFVEIEKQIGYEGPGRKLVLLEVGIGYAFAKGNQFSRGLGISGETSQVGQGFSLRSLIPRHRDDGR